MARRSKGVGLLLLLLFAFGVSSSAAAAAAAVSAGGVEAAFLNLKPSPGARLLNQRRRNTKYTTEPRLDSMASRKNGTPPKPVAVHSKRGPVQQHQLRMASSSSSSCSNGMIPTTTKTTMKPMAGETSLEYEALRLAPQQQQSGKNSINNKVYKKQHRTNGLNIPYESTLTALRRYRAVHGDLAMPRRFFVPSEAANDHNTNPAAAAAGYPSEWVGLDLASTVYNMKWWKQYISGSNNSKEKSSERVDELNQLGFIWERLQPEWNLVLEALVTYHSLNGDVMVPNAFVVPHGYRQWPLATWNIPLGNCVVRIRARNDFLMGVHSAARRNQLDALGFVWDVREHQFLRFFGALRHYAKLNQAGAFASVERPNLLRVPSSFFVPTHTDQWPKELWNYPLGAKCTAVRQKELYIKNNPKRQYILQEELGFCCTNGNADLSWYKVVHAAAIYSKLHDRTLDVPYKFVVPGRPSQAKKTTSTLATVTRGTTPTTQFANMDAGDWPEYLWGLPLGQRLKDIRVTGAYLKGEDADARRQQLDALGFIWNVREHRFQLFYAALQHYARLHQCGPFTGGGKKTDDAGSRIQSFRVPSAFVVPSDSNMWPRELWKFNLGKTTASVRLQGLYDVYRNRKRRELLEELGFFVDSERFASNNGEG